MERAELSLRGDDRVTMNLRARDHVKLIFHRGAKKSADADRFSFEDKTGLMTWQAADRAFVAVSDLEDLGAKAEKLRSLVQAWIAATTDSPIGP
jgi:hypothetical protein